MALTPKQEAFINEYLKSWNATDAARLAGYAFPNVEGSRLLVNPSIKAKIQARLTELKMGADEVLSRLTTIARGGLSEFLDFAVPGLPMFDFEKAEKANKLGLLKKYKVTKQGVEIEIHDSLKALELLGRHHGLFNDKIEINWRKELEAMNENASEVFEQLIREIATTEPPSPTPDIARGDSEIP